VLCTPPGKDGAVHPAILFAAQLSGIKTVLKVGGAQAIAALAYGTESLQPVNKIFGPGNRYVTCAKMLVQKDGVAIDLPAGPSEVLVVADETSVPAFVAADLLSQAEHDPDSQAVLLTTSGRVLDAVLEEVNKQCVTLPRYEIVQKALSHSVAVLLDNQTLILDAVNFYAPEHLILACENAELMAARVRNAGSIFIGNFTPEVAGDYASGTNHTLPTYGYAHSYSGVSLDSFIKKITVQHITQKGLQRLAPTLTTLAAAEGLAAHERAVRVRLEN
jgi:histidinol dehydrogenase